MGRRKLDPASPEGIEAALKAAEAERIFRDKRRVKFCPVCGRRPEIPPIKGRHIYNFQCEKCTVRFVIRVC